MPAAIMFHAKDPKEKLLEEIGDISETEIFNNQVLCAVYQRPEKTRGGIILPGSNLDEDKYQSKVGLIIKMGSSAFEEDGDWFKGVKFALHDWVVFRPSDGWSITLKAKNGSEVLCRIIDDVNVKGRVQQPDAVW